jgi:hypothetical protein
MTMSLSSEIAITEEQQRFIQNILQTACENGMSAVDPTPPTRVYQLHFQYDTQLMQKTVVEDSFVWLSSEGCSALVVLHKHIEYAVVVVFNETRTQPWIVCLKSDSHHLKLGPHDNCTLNIQPVPLQAVFALNQTPQNASVLPPLQLEPSCLAHRVPPAELVIPIHPLPAPGQLMVIVIFPHCVRNDVFALDLEVLTLLPLRKRPITEWDDLVKFLHRLLMSRNSYQFFNGRLIPDKHAYDQLVLNATPTDKFGGALDGFVRFHGKLIPKKQLTSLSFPHTICVLG